MEQNHKDPLVSRRQALITILGIPPALLGLAAMAGDLSSLPAVATTANTRTLGAAVLAEYQTVQSQLWTGYYTGSGQDQLKHAWNWIKHLSFLQPNAAELPALLEMQSLAFQHLTNVIREYAPDQQVFASANQAVYLAREAGMVDLLIVALLRRAETYFERGKTDLAVLDVEEMLSLTERGRPEVRAAMQISGARILSTVAQDRQDRRNVAALIETSGNMVLSGDHPAGTYHLKIDAPIYLIRSSQALLYFLEHHRAALPNPKELTLEIQRKLGQVQMILAPDQLRRIAMLRLAQAQTEIYLGEHDLAAQYAAEVPQILTQIHSRVYLPTLVQVHTQLKATSYGESPMVARLGLGIQHVQTL